MPRITKSVFKYNNIVYELGSDEVERIILAHIKKHHIQDPAQLTSGSWKCSLSGGTEADDFAIWAEVVWQPIRDEIVSRTSKDEELADEGVSG